jgi:hypothetical protein
MAGFTLTRWIGLVRNQARTEAEFYPAKAVGFLHDRKLPSRLFVYYDWGGYAIWKLYPEYRVFVDGRADLYGDDMLHQFQDAALLRAGWKQVLERWGVQAVLVPPASALAQGLLLDQHWHAEYRDAQAILFLPTPLPLDPPNYQESASAEPKSEKKCTGGLRICETTPNWNVSPDGRGYETTASRAISKRHKVELSLCRHSSGCCGLGKAGPIPGLQSNLGEYS